MRVWDAPSVATRDGDAGARVAITSRDAARAQAAAAAGWTQLQGWFRANGFI